MTTVLALIRVSASGLLESHLPIHPTSHPTTPTSRYLQAPATNWLCLHLLNQLCWFVGLIATHIPICTPPPSPPQNTIAQPSCWHTRGATPHGASKWAAGRDTLNKATQNIQAKHARLVSKRLAPKSRKACHPAHCCARLQFDRYGHGPMGCRGRKGP